MRAIPIWSPAAPPRARCSSRPACSPPTSRMPSRSARRRRVPTRDDRAAWPACWPPAACSSLDGRWPRGSRRTIRAASSPDYPFAPPMRPHLVGRRGKGARAVRLSGAPGGSARAALRGRSQRRCRSMVARSLVGVSGRIPGSRSAATASGATCLSRLVARRAAVARASAIGAALLALVARRGGRARPPGIAGGWIDEALMRAADLVLVLPGIYVILALRGAMPLVLSTARCSEPSSASWGWSDGPEWRAGVRGIVVTERRAEYAEAARALGAGPLRDRDASSAAGDSRISPRPGDRPRARLHPGGGDGFFCRSWICGAHAELGRDAAGRRRRLVWRPTRPGSSPPPPPSSAPCWPCTRPHTAAKVPDGWDYFVSS